MNLDIFILLYVIIGLSVIFFASSAAVLILRNRHGFHFHPLAYTAVLLAALIPVTTGVTFSELKVYRNAPGDVRIEVYEADTAPGAGETGEKTGEFRISASAYRRLTAGAELACAVWFVVTAAKLSFYIADYFDSVRVLIKRSKVCRVGELHEIFYRTRKRVGLRRNVVLRVTELEISPCTCGFTSPIVFISASAAESFPPGKLELIFLHELIHIRNCDIVTKFLVLIAESFHGLSPLGRHIGKAVLEDCEYRCDAGVLAVCGDARRFEYISTIIEIAERNLESPAEPVGRYDGAARRSELLNRASGTSGGSGTSESNNGKFILKRYEKMKKRRAATKQVLYIFPLMVAAAAVNMFIMSSVSVVNRADPGVDLLNPCFSAVLCEYYGLDGPEEIAMSHVRGIYSMELGVSGRFEAYKASPYASVEIPEEEKLLVCLLNEGRVPTADGYTDGVSLTAAKRYGYRYASDILPDVIRADAMRFYYPGGKGTFLVSGLYRYVDAGDAAVEAYTERMYAAVLAEYGLAVGADIGEIRRAVEAYCAEAGVEYRGNGSVSEALSVLGREQLSELSPLSRCVPVFVLKEDVTEEQLFTAADHVYRSRLAEDKLIFSPALDLRDISLFTGLKTLIFRDGLYTEEDGVYSSRTFAVIGEKPDEKEQFLAQ